MAHRRGGSLSRSGTRRGGARLVMVSNRLPFVMQRDAEGRWRAQPGNGGLVTAVLPVLSERGGVWIGWPGTSGPARGSRAMVDTASAGSAFEIGTVALDAQDVRAFYYGFANEIIWPLFHDLPSLCNFEPAYWIAFQKAGRKYAKAVALRTARDDFIWVHDYHLMGVGAELRDLGSKAPLGFFLHIPFPSPDIFRRLPWREQVLDALLHYDLVGFQTRHDLDNFIACVKAFRAHARVGGRGSMLSVTTSRGATRAGSFPISIDYAQFVRDADVPEVLDKAQELHRLLPRRKLVLGIDRLDYTKGITLRLKAFQLLLETNPALRGKLSLIQVVVPSREDIAQYDRMKTEIEQLVSRINGAFARPGGWVPVWYEFRSLSRLELLAYYRAADIALITPLKDGMNLVAKEYCACSIEEDCVLILSEAAGAAEQLGEHAILVNPYDVEGVAQAIKRAHRMPRAERIARMGAMRRSIRRNDVFRWVDSFLAAAKP